MGLVAVAGGFAYKVIHIIWLKKFDAVSLKCLDDDDLEVADIGEGEKLNIDSKTRDASTSMSLERLSLMFKFNQMGSMSSLSRSKVSELD
jgi:hypothetical protein